MGFIPFSFLAVMGSSDAVTAHAHTDGWCSSGISLSTSAFSAEFVYLQKWLTSAELPNQRGCAGRLEGLKRYAALPLPQISPC